MTAETANFSDYPAVRDQWQYLATGPGRAYRRDAPDLLQERLALLQSQAPIVPRIDAHIGNFQHFLGETSALYPQANARGFVMDNAKAYRRAVQLLPREYLEQKEQASYKDSTSLYDNAAIYATQHGLEHYFGSYPNERALELRERLLKGRAHSVSETSPPYSVAAFKRLAACAERTAVANNLLHIFGTAPVFETGQLAIDDADATLHTFLLVPGEDEPVLYDPSNPIESFGSWGRIDTTPALYPVGEIVIKERRVLVGGMIGTLIRDKAGVAAGERFMQFVTAPQGSLLQPQ